MATLRETRPLPGSIDTPERVESFLTLLAARLAPGIESSVGSIAWTIGERTGVDWTAEGFHPDGTLVVVRVAPASSELFLYLDGAPLLKPPAAPSLWVNLGLIGTVVLGVGVGVASRSIGWGIGATLLAVATWIGVDVVRGIRADRAAAARPIDAEAWREQLDQAIAAAAATLLRPAPTE